MAELNVDTLDYSSGTGTMTVGGLRVGDLKVMGDGTVPASVIEYKNGRYETSLYRVTDGDQDVPYEIYGLGTVFGSYTLTADTVRAGGFVFGDVGSRVKMDLNDHIEVTSEVVRQTLEDAKTGSVYTVTYAGFRGLADTVTDPEPSGSYTVSLSFRRAVSSPEDSGFMVDMGSTSVTAVFDGGLNYSITAETGEGSAVHIDRFHYSYDPASGQGDDDWFSLDIADGSVGLSCGHISIGGHTEMSGITFGNVPGEADSLVIDRIVYRDPAIGEAEFGITEGGSAVTPAVRITNVLSSGDPHRIDIVLRSADIGIPLTGARVVISGTDG